MFRETGAAGRYGWTLSNLGAVYEQRGDVALAEKTFRDAVSRLRTTHEQGYLVEAERRLAEVLVKQGKADEADRIDHGGTEPGRARGRLDASLAAARAGLVRAAQGRTGEAEAAFSAALEIIEPTMYTILTNDIRAHSSRSTRTDSGAAACEPTERRSLQSVETLEEVLFLLA